MTLAAVTAAPAVDAAVLADLCDSASLPRDVINTDQEPAGAYWREAGIWIDADSVQQLTAAVAVLAEAIGSGAAEAISELVVVRRGGAYGAAPSYEARLALWEIR